MKHNIHNISHSSPQQLTEEEIDNLLLKSRRTTGKNTKRPNQHPRTRFQEMALSPINQDVPSSSARIFQQLMLKYQLTIGENNSKAMQQLWEKIQNFCRQNPEYAQQLPPHFAPKYLLNLHGRMRK